MHRTASRVSPTAAVVALLILLISTSGCQQSPEQDSPTQVPVENYDQDSWERLIPATCKSFFDGCNNCRRADKTGQVACTRRFCSEYQQPRCLDETDLTAGVE